MVRGRPQPLEVKTFGWSLVLGTAALTLWMVAVSRNVVPLWISNLALDLPYMPTSALVVTIISALLAIASGLVIWWERRVLSKRVR